MSLPTLGHSALKRIALAVVLAEVRRLRGPGASVLAAADWPEGTAIGEEGLGLDSLERLGALGALAETFGLGEEALPERPPLTVGDWTGWLGRRRDAIATIAVMSSGSTGAPQTCRHPIADLVAEAADLGARFAGRQRVVAFVPAHHLYGLIWTALLPDVLGIPVVDRVLGSPVGLRPGDLVVAVPDQWQGLLRLRLAIPSDCIAVSSAGLLTEALASDLLDAGFARVVDVYGSSETGAIGLREAPAAGYDLLPRWTLQAEAGDFSIVDRDGRALPIPDHVERLGPRRIRPIGRRDGAVKVAGHTVWPQRVERALGALGGVAEVAVRLGGNGRLKAFVVPAAGWDPETLQVALEAFAEERLAFPERPKSFLFGPSLPLSEMGKRADWD